MRTRFDEELSQLKQELTAMGGLCERIIAMTAKALLQRDTALAKQVTVLGPEIDKKEQDIESVCLKLLLQQQPVARDLRKISTALKMITDMERIGDQAEDIAEIIPYLDGHAGEEREDIQLMAETVITMVTDSVDAYVNRDLQLAHAVIPHDDIVDLAFDRVKTKLIKRIARDQSRGEYPLDLLMIAKYFERIGDHAVNIAEWVIFSITGQHG